MQHFFKTLILFSKTAIWLAIVMVLCLMPAKDLPETSLAKIPNFDKLVHFGMYFIFAVLLFRPYKTIKIPVLTCTLLTSLIAGGMIEVLQYAVTDCRSADWRDFAADFAGAVAGLVFYNLLIKDRPWERLV
jgi:VanZ family protein